MSISEEMGREIAAALSDAPDGKSRRKTIRDYARCLGGVTEQYLYSVARKHGWNSGRKRKSTAGKRRVDVTDEQLRQIAEIIENTRAKGKSIISTWRAIQIAEDSGFVPRGVVTESFFNRWFSGEGYYREKIETYSPHTHQASLHPNHVHLLDVTNCTQWYLLKDGNLGHQSEKQIYKNKEGKNPKGKKILRYMLIDHYSGAFFPYYFLADGECATDTRTFLIRAWREKPDPHRFPFHGVPKILYGDKGPGNQSTLIQEFLEALGVKWIPHKTGNPRAKGTVESNMFYWERNFEVPLRLGPAYSIDRLNQDALDFAIYVNTKKKHKRHGGGRFGLWNTIQKEQLRILPDDEILSTLVSSGWQWRHVGPDLMLHVETNTYRVPLPDLMNQKVRVCFDPYHYPDLLVDAGERRLRLKKVEFTSAGFVEGAAVIGQDFKSAPKTKRMKKQESLAKVEPQKNRQYKVFGEGVKNVGNVGFAKRAGTPIDAVPRIREIPRIVAMKMIIKKLERGLTPEENRYIHAHYKHTIPEPDIKMLVDRFRGGLGLDDAENVQTMIG